MKNHYSNEIQETFHFNMEKRIFDFDEGKCLELIFQKGREVYGSEFSISTSLAKIYSVILCYAVEDVARSMQRKISLQKGILLMGAPYSGKTAIMHLCKIFFKRKNSYQIYNVKKLTCDFAQKGYAALEEVLSLKYPICLDGIGEEKEVKHYGNTCDIVPEIVEYLYQHRYDFKYPMLHITTRLSAPQLEKRYGASFRRMIKDLMNAVVVG